MESTSSNSRVVRVSNLRDLKQAGWLAAVGSPLIAVSVVYLWSHGWKRDDGSSVAAMLGVTVLPMLSVFPLLLMLFISGTWIADDRGVEFMPYAPRLRKWKFVAWAEVTRVKWMPAVAVLDSSTGDAGGAENEHHLEPPQQS